MKSKVMVAVGAFLLATTFAMTIADAADSGDATKTQAPQRLKDVKILKCSNKDYVLPGTTTPIDGRGLIELTFTAIDFGANGTMTYDLTYVSESDYKKPTRCTAVPLLNNQVFFSCDSVYFNEKQVELTSFITNETRTGLVELEQHIYLKDGSGNAQVLADYRGNGTPGRRLAFKCSSETVE